MLLGAFGSTTQDFGALLVGAGAVLVLSAVVMGAVGLLGATWDGTFAQPTARLGASAELAGAFLVAIGSIVLLLASASVATLAVIVAVSTGLVVFWTAAPLQLRRHMAVDARVAKTECASWSWCATHPFWRPDDGKN